MLDTVGAATGDTTNVRSDRPTGRHERQASASPTTSQGSIPLAFPSPAAVAMRDEWHGRPSNRDSRRHARFHFSPRDRLARHERAILGVMPPLARSGAAARYGRRRQGAAAPSRPGGRRRSRTDRCHELTLHDAPGSDSSDLTAHTHPAAAGECQRHRSLVASRIQWAFRRRDDMVGRS